MGRWLAIDQSTSATKACLFDDQGGLVERQSLDHEQIYPQPGWVEHDAEQIYRNVCVLITDMCRRHEMIECLSITNQRETVAVFDRATGRPLHHAIVWQDRRGAEPCRQIEADGLGPTIRRRTGLIVDTYFPAPKLLKLFADHPALAAKVRAGDALVGTIDSYLIHRLTRGQVFATDHTNASRTLLYDIHRMAYDAELCERFGVTTDVLPEPRDSDAEFGQTDVDDSLDRPLSIRGVMADSQAALLAHRAFAVGQAKVTFGTGSSILINIGDQPTDPPQGMVTTVAWTLDGKPAYALEGIINCTGATINWLRDQMKLIDGAADTESIARSIEQTDGVYLVPAFAGLSAPDWAPDARAAIVGLSRSSDRAHIVRAALESIAWQIRDVLDLLPNGRQSLTRLHGDGGMIRNELLMQMVADFTGAELITSDVAELSALGAAVCGMRSASANAAPEWWRGDFVAQQGRTYQPTTDRADIERRHREWRQAVSRVL